MSKIEYDPEICNFKNEKKKCPCCAMRAASENALHNCRANPIYQDINPVLEKDDPSEPDKANCTNCDKIKKLKERIAAKKAEIEKKNLK